MAAITIRVTEAARRDLDALAARKRRDPRDQAALLIESALRRSRRDRPALTDEAEGGRSLR